MLHLGELGDATDAMIVALDESVERPQQQRIFKTQARLPLDDFPLPAYHLIQTYRYMMLPIQWSSGCPYTCEFCDIPAMYGRVPRFKSAARLLAELTVLAQQDFLGAVFFVDDNLVGNKTALRSVLPQIVAWQRRSGYKLRFVGECTLNIAAEPNLLQQLRDARFTDFYFGIESPDPNALVAIDKKHNLRLPLGVAIETIHSYGLGVHAGFILGLDSDTPDTPEKILRFVEDNNIPMPIINLLYAPPKTELRRRLELEGRILPPAEATVSNVKFKEPNEVVYARWRSVTAAAYAPQGAFRRFRHQAKFTYGHRLPAKLLRSQVTWRTLPYLLYAARCLTISRLRILACGPLPRGACKAGTSLAKCQSPGGLDMLRTNLNPSTHLVKRAAAGFSFLALWALGLAAGPTGCGDGLVAGQTYRPDGLAPLYGEDCEQADGTYILGYSSAEGGDQSAMDADLALIKSAGGTVLGNYTPHIAMAVAEIPPAVLPQLRKNTGLAYVSKNCKYQPQSVGLARVPWGLDRIDQRQRPSDYVYQMAGTGRGVDVYVVDTGIFVEHPDFGGRAHKLYNAIKDGRDAGDCEGHGTEVAALIGGLDHGVAKEANLYSVRVVDCAGIATDATIADGLQFAIATHAASGRPAVINLSIAQSMLGKAASQALDDASRAGILVVAAAGNFGVDACTHFPAARPLGVISERDPEPIVVGVIDEDDQAVQSGVSRRALIKFDYGSCIDVFAPGARVQTISHLDTTREIVDSGTSLAAAHVSGVAAIYLEKFARATPAQIKQAIIDQATPGVVLGAAAPNPRLAYSIPEVLGARSSLRAIQLAGTYPTRPAVSRGEVFEDTSCVVPTMSLCSSPSGKDPFPMRLIPGCRRNHERIVQ